MADTSKAEIADSSAAAAPAGEKAPSTFGVFVKGFPEGTTEEKIKDVFSRFGEILPKSRLRTNRKFVIIEFASQEAADRAVAAKESLTIGGAPLTVEHRVPRQQKPRRSSKNGAAPAEESGPSTRIYVAPLPTDTTQEDIKGLFAQFGEIQSANVRARRDRTGFAFVTFEKVESAQAAVDQSEKLTLKDTAVKIEFRTTRAAEAKPRKAAGAKPRVRKVKKAAEGEQDGAAAGAEAKPNGERRQKKAAAAPAAEPAPATSVYIRKLPFGTTQEALKEALAKFGEISRVSVVATPTTVFIDYASEDDLAKTLASANDTAKEEKKGSFGSALLEVSRSRSRKTTNQYSMYIKGFIGGQTPTEEDIRQIFNTAAPSNISIHPARCFGFVDFATPAAMNAALEAGKKSEVTLPGSAPLEFEQSKETVKKPGNRRFRRGPRAKKDNAPAQESTA